ncbi:MAG: TolC family protein [Bacteroidota bacterium]
MSYRLMIASVIVLHSFSAAGIADLPPSPSGAQDCETIASSDILTALSQGGDIASSDTVVMTARTAQEVFLRENLTLLAARYHLSASEADLVAARLFPNPQLSVNASYIDLKSKPVDYASTQTSYRIDQLIELGGKRGKRIDVATHSVESAKSDFQNTLLQLVGDVKENFFEVVFTQKLLELADTNYRIFKQSVEIARTRYKTGDIGEAELQKLTLAQLDVIQNFSDARQNLTEAQSQFRRMINLPPSVQLNFVYNFRPSLKLPDKDTLTTVALNSRADLTSQREKTLMQQSRIDLAHANAIPDLTLGVEIDRQGPDFRNTFGGGVGIALPIFNRNQDEIQRAEAESQASTVEQKRLENSIVNDVDAAFEKYKESWNILEAISTSTLDNANGVRAMAVRSYNTGNIGLIDFLETQRICNDAVQSYYNALKRLLSNQTELERAVGKEIFKEQQQ